MSDTSSDNESDDERKQGIDDPDAVTKYRLAGEMANDVIRQVISKLVPGATVLEVCKFGDDLILSKTKAV